MTSAAKLASAALAASALFLIAAPSYSAQGPEVVRKMLMQQDLPMAGYQNSLVSVEIPVGGREGRHTHPGPVIVHVESGAITLDHDGKPTTTYRAGETFIVESGKVHEGINNGNVPARAIASFVTEKSKPLTTQAQ